MQNTGKENIIRRYRDFRLLQIFVRANIKKTFYALQIHRIIPATRVEVNIIKSYSLKTIHRAIKYGKE